ncbi:MAG TPA: type II secretion system protein [Gammaproteobacteria bacterium]|nr:type II secretion system protein [Gammaproteobacteria bacterium]
MSTARSGGFSLIEMVVVIAIAGIMAAVAGLFILGPVRSFNAQSRRAALVNDAALALLRMSRDIHAALPNSVRVQGGELELLYTLDGNRYRSAAPGSAADRLQFNKPDAAFNVFSPFTGLSSANQYLAVYPLGEQGANPYRDPVMTPAMNITQSTVPGPGSGGSSETRITLPTAHQFPYQSPANRIYLVSGPVSYVCSGGRLLRYSGYPVQSSQPSASALASMAASGAAQVGTVTADLKSCSFSYQTLATARRSALVTMQVVLERHGEQVRLMRQVHVDNTP